MARVQADRLNLVVTAVTAQSQHSHSTVTAQYICTVTADGQGAGRQADPDGVTLGIILVQISKRHGQAPRRTHAARSRVTRVYRGVPGVSDAVSDAKGGIPVSGTSAE